MKNVPQIPRKPITALIKNMLDDWRRSLQLSQSKIIARVVEAHKAIDAERTTEIVFEEERRGRDLVHCQKINMQRVYRWLESDDDGPGNMPVNFLPSVLAALPVDLRVQLANDILAPCGLAVRPLNAAEEGGFDPMEHLSRFLVEFPEAKQAVMKMGSCSSPDTARAAMKELDDVLRVAKEARDGIEARIANSPVRAVA